MSSKKIRACCHFSPFPSIDDLPEEILIGSIFIKLPGSVLVQCRSICKQWFRILTDPKFIRMHFKHQKPNKKLLFGPSYSIKLPPDHSLVDVLSIKTAVTREGVFFSVDVQGSAAADAVRLPGFKLPAEFELMRTLGHSNGIVCILVRRMDITWSTMLDSWHILSWHLLFGNPSTGYHKIISDKRLNYGNLIVGFGYDSSSDDFKFVQIDDCSRMPRIYSLKSNSWKSCVGKSDKLGIASNYTVARKEVDPLNIGCALGNSIYWVTEEWSLVVKFDLEKEGFKETPFPVEFEEGKNRLTIKVVEDVLYAMNTCHKDGVVDVDIWSFSEEELWIELTTLTFPCDAFGSYFDFYPVHFMKDKKHILCCVEYFTDDSYVRLDKRKHLWVDLETNRVEDYLIKGISSGWLEKYNYELQYSSYVDSLVFPTLL